MAAVAAFVGTAALAIALTRAPAHHDVSLSSGVAGQACAASGLEAWLGTGAAGGRPGGARLHRPLGIYYALEFTNVSGRTCSLYGYPEVSAYPDSAVTGRPIGLTARRDTSVPARPVTLAPGATAHAVLRVTVTANPEPASCVKMIAAELRVRLPRPGQSAFAPARIPVCAGGHVSLSVQAIQARPGVPGYTAAP